MRPTWHNLIISGVHRFDCVHGGCRANFRRESKLETISGLGARNIGSATMSGRIAAIDAVHEGKRLTIYVGAASGGVWKSTKWRLDI